MTGLPPGDLTLEGIFQPRGCSAGAECEYAARWSATGWSDSLKQRYKTAVHWLTCVGCNSCQLPLAAGTSSPAHCDGT